MIALCSYLHNLIPCQKWQRVRLLHTVKLARREITQQSNLSHCQIKQGVSCPFTLIFHIAKFSNVIHYDND